MLPSLSHRNCRQNFHRNPCATKFHSDSAGKHQPIYQLQQQSNRATDRAWPRRWKNRCQNNAKLHVSYSLPVFRHTKTSISIPQTHDQYARQTTRKLAKRHLAALSCIRTPHLRASGARTQGEGYRFKATGRPTPGLTPWSPEQKMAQVGH